MYKLKAGTISDIEDIWMIIERTWLESRISGLDRVEMIKMLDLTHSIKKIRAEILNNYQRYILISEREAPVAFASYSVTGVHPPDFQIHKMYNLPSTEGKGYNKVLISHIEHLAIDRGCRKLTVNVKQEEKKQYFESLGFLATQKPDTAEQITEQKTFTMVKVLTKA